jgi:hypothetical protein
MLSLPKIYMCLGLTALLILRASGQRNRYSNNNDNNNNRNGGYSSGSTQVGDISNPEEEGNSMDIPCGASFSSGSVVSCIFQHQLPTTSTSGNSNSRHMTCGQNGCSGDGLDQSYLNSHSIEYNQQPCTLRVQQASPDDAGDWTCHLQVEDGTLKSTIGISEVFVSNKSSIFITDPDDNDDTIEYDIARGNDRITATCTAYGGSPVPAFKWYIDDDKSSNQIEEGDGDASFDEASDDDIDSRMGRRAWSRITFKPDLQTLCDLNLDEACDVVNEDEDFNGLNFNLVCKVEQPQFSQYQSWNKQQEATVMVEVSSAIPLVGVLSKWVVVALLSYGLRYFS